MNNRYELYKNIIAKELELKSKSGRKAPSTQEDYFKKVEDLIERIKLMEEKVKQMEKLINEHLMGLS